MSGFLLPSPRMDYLMAKVKAGVDLSEEEAAEVIAMTDPSLPEEIKQWIHEESVRVAYLLNETEERDDHMTDSLSELRERAALLAEIAQREREAEE